MVAERVAQGSAKVSNSIDPEKDVTHEDAFSLVGGYDDS
jgi:hypothetical protein